MAKGTNTGSKNLQSVSALEVDTLPVKDSETNSEEKKEVTNEADKHATSEAPTPEKLPVDSVPEQPAPPPPPQKPTPGRIVKYFPDKNDGLKGYGSDSWPAIITEVHDETVSLQVFSKYSTVPKQNVPAVAKKGNEGGHWEWPSRD